VLHGTEDYGAEARIVRERGDMELLPTWLVEAGQVTRHARVCVDELLGDPTRELVGPPAKVRRRVLGCGLESHAVIMPCGRKRLTKRGATLELLPPEEGSRHTIPRSIPALSPTQASQSTAHTSTTPTTSGSFRWHATTSAGNAPDHDALTQALIADLDDARFDAARLHILERDLT